MRNSLCFFISALILWSFDSHAQELEKTDSIFRLLLATPGDTDLVHTLNRHIEDLSYSHSDTALYYAKQQDSLSRSVGYYHGIAMALNQQGVCYELSGDMYTAIELYLQAARLAQEQRAVYYLMQRL